MIGLDRIIAIRNTVTVYRNGEQCVKVFDCHYRRSALYREAMCHALAMESDLPVPALIGTGEIEGHPTLITAYIRGKTIHRLLIEQPERKEEFLHRLADMQYRIHCTPVSMPTRFSDHLAQCIRQSLLDTDQKTDLLGRLAAMPEGNALCHGAWGGDHLLITRENAAYALDWGHAALGDTAADVAITVLSLYLNGDPEGAALYQRRYAALAGIAESNIDAWLPLCAAAHMSQCTEDTRKRCLAFL